MWNPGSNSFIPGLEKVIRTSHLWKMTAQRLVLPASFGKYYLETIRNAIQRDLPRENRTCRTAPQALQRLIHVRRLSGGGFSNAYDAFLTSKYILLTPCFLALYRSPNHSIKPHFVHILPPTPTWHGKAKSHLTETQFYMLWVWKSPKSRCCSEKKCNKIFEAPFSKLYRHTILKKKFL